jgi:hypothetical protein
MKKDRLVKERGKRGCKREREGEGGKLKSVVGAKPRKTDGHRRRSLASKERNRNEKEIRKGKPSPAGNRVKAKSPERNER